MLHAALALLFVPGAAMGQAQDSNPVLSIAEGHLQSVVSLEWSADGTQLLTGSSDNTARIWDVSSGALLRTFTNRKGHVRGIRSTVTRAAFVRGEDQVLVASSNGTQIWDKVRNIEVSVLAPDIEMVTTAAVRADGSAIAIAGHAPAASGAKPFLRFLDRTNGRARDLPADRLHSINALSFSQDGQILALGGAEVSKEVSGGVETRGLVRLLHPDGRSAGGFAGFTETVKWVAFSRDSRDLFALANGEIIRWRIDVWEKVRAFPGDVAALSADGSLLAADTGASSAQSGSDAVVLWNTDSGAKIAAFDWPEAQRETVGTRIASLAFDSDRTKIAAGFTNGKIAIWEVSTRKLLRVWHPAVPGAFKTQLINRDANRMAVADGAAGTIWDLRTGRSVFVLGNANNEVEAVALSPNGNLVAMAARNGEVFVWDSVTGRARYSLFASSGAVSALAFSHDGSQIITAGYRGDARLWRIDDGQEIRAITTELAIPRAIATTPSHIAIGDETGTVYIFNGDGSVRRGLLTPPGVNATVLDLAFDPSGEKLAVAYGNGYNRAIIYELAGARVQRLDPHQGFVQSIQFDPTGRFLVTGSSDETAKLWDVASGRLVRTLDHSGSVTAVAFASQGRHLVTYARGAVHFWRMADYQKTMELVNVRSRGWTVFARDGRFDSVDIDAMAGMHWLMPDAPFKPLRPEIFMRDYFEPRLLPRRLACEAAEPERPDACRQAFKAVRSLVSLNRSQPEVSIVSVTPGVMSDEVVVDIMVSEPTEAGAGGAYDLRLFRDGQIVAQWPEETATETAEETLAAWSKRTRLIFDGDGRTGSKKIRVQIPTRSSDRDVLFTAYAFNSDRVKSATSSYSFALPNKPAVRPRRAFVVAVGVSAYENAARKLDFAAKDARDTLQLLTRLRDHEVIPVLLISENARREAGKLIPAKDHARKENLRAVIDILSGRDIAQRERLRPVLGKTVEKLGRANPDDTVLIFFSGHGHADEDGHFYLLPSNSGAESKISSEQLSKFISSDELATWLRGIDAGELVLIVDTCHAAGSVPDGFKPGPMGDRGLGQVAYDKGMRILAATQAAEVAIESERIGQGLLTFALVKESLRRDRQTGAGEKVGPAPSRRSRPPAETQANPTVAADLDRNGVVTLDEWLVFAANRVPALYQDLRSGKLRLRDPSTNPALLETPEYAQTPSLLDFHRRRFVDVIIHR